MNKIIKLLSITAICLFAGVSVFAKPQETQKCQLGDVMFGGHISIILDKPSPGIATIDIGEVSVALLHKDGTRDVIKLGAATGKISARTSQEAERKIKAKALAQAAARMAKKCQEHGCSQQ